MNQAIRLRTRLPALAGALLLCSATLAHAQYMWIDAKGIKQYSDRPPPPSVPLKDIRQAPRGQFSADNMPPPEAAPTAPAAAPKAPPTLAEREADFSKRQKAKAEQDKKERDDTARRSAQAANCAGARRARAALDSGSRISTTDSNGERGYLDEAQREVESKKVNQAMADCKGG
ncbi:DUF4124 domain-containing protein [Massilia sp. DWR3-1-1]|uniref:DUF4124 domain-containing protein n=1 Tax=Massilia sp. DWR3-1-1 TaxID=2804559 RepID=UPI003CF4FA1E